MTGETVHLLVSVRSVPDDAASSGEDGKQVRESAVQDLDTENARNLLDRMGSGLKSVRTADGWKDIYFEIDQQAADSAPIGKITAEDAAG